MSIFIGCAILTFIASAYAVLLNRKLIETYFLAIVTTVAIIYCFGLLDFGGALLVGLICVALVSVLSLAYFIYSVRKDKNSIHNIELLQGLIIFFILCSAAFYISYGLRWYHGDEFSGWGSSVRHMYFYDAFPTYFNRGVGTVTVPNNLPGTAVLHYFFTRFSKSFYEYPAYFSMNILYMGLYMSFLKNIFTKRHFIKSVFIAGLFIILPYQPHSLFPPYVALPIDAFMGLLFGATIIYYYFYRYYESKYGLLMVSAAAFLLTVSKDLGIFFAFVVFGVMFVDIVLFRRDSVKEMFLNQSMKTRVINVIRFILPAILSVFAYLSWQVHLKLSGSPIHPLAGGRPTVSNILSFISGNITETQKDMVDRFISMQFQRMPSFRFSPVEIILFLAAGGMILAFLSKKKIPFKRGAAALGSITFGALLYILVLLLINIFSFYSMGDYNFPSWNRYLMTYFVGMAAFLVFFLIIHTETGPETSKQENNILSAKAGKRQKSKQVRANKLPRKKSLMQMFDRCTIACLASSLLFVMFLPANSNYLKMETYNVRQKFAHQYAPRSDEAIIRWMPYILEELSGTDSLLYIVSQEPLRVDSRGHEEPYGGWWRIRMIDVAQLYPFMALPHQRGMTDIYEEIPEGLPDWPPPPTAISPEEWEQNILDKNFKLVYIDLVDESFIRSYGRFFTHEILDGMLYRAENQDGRLSIVPFVPKD